MPFGDGTGPFGKGRGTGRGAGGCAGPPAAGNMSPVQGRGLGGRGRAGGGWGWRNMFRATGLTGWQRAAAPPVASADEPEIQTLKDRAASMESALGEIRKRIEELGAKSA